jgi:glutamate-1-semialdehyde aminotransferase
MGWQNSFSLPHSLTEKVASKLCRKFGYDAVKITQSGSAACDCAVRIARCYTGRDKVMWTGYHGSGDIFISQEKPGAGIPLDLCSDKFQTLKELMSCLSKHVAAVIIEPVQLDISENRRQELIKLRKITSKLGIILIFDEIITGFRVPKASISNYWGIKPDLLCLGKAPGNGFPISFTLGPDKMMNHPDYFISNTHNANQVALESVNNTIDCLPDSTIHRFWDRSGVFLHRIQEILKPVKCVRLVGYNTRAEWQWDGEMGLFHLTSIWEQMASAGHIVGKAHFANMLHTKATQTKYLEDLRTAVANRYMYTPKGPCPSFVFRRNS